MAGEYIVARMTVPASVTVSATNSGGGPTSVAVTAGTYNIDELCAELQTRLNASRPPSSGAWTVTISATTGQVTINCTGTWSLSWTSTALRDVFGFTANITSVSAAQTGTKQARGLWFPHCPLMLDTDPMTAPLVDDGASSVSPTGVVYKVVGVSSYRHRNLRYSHVPQAYAWARFAPIGNAAYETFYIDTQAGLGHSWFSPASVCVVGWDNGGTPASLGNGTVSTWQFPSPQTLDELSLAAAPWTGLVAIVLGDARSAG